MHNKKEVLELCQVGQFIYRVDSKFKIIEKPQPPSPDFIIEHNSNLVGLEHTRLLTENASKYFKVNSIIEYAQEIYKAKFPDDKVLAIISIKNDELKYKQHQKSEIANLISQAVYDTRHNGSCMLPLFISNLRTTTHSEISFSYKEKGWDSAPFLTQERLLSEIKKKESKINGYKKSPANLSEYWLVLIIGSLNSASYKYNERTNYKCDSKFDRVYLKTDFNNDIIRIK